MKYSEKGAQGGDDNVVCLGAWHHGRYVNGSDYGELALPDTAFHKCEFHLGNTWYIPFCIHSLFFTSFWQNVVFAGNTQPILYLF